MQWHFSWVFYLAKKSSNEIHTRRKIDLKIKLHLSSVFVPFYHTSYKYPSYSTSSKYYLDTCYSDCNDIHSFILLLPLSLPSLEQWTADARSIDAGISIQTEVACAPITGTSTGWLVSVMSSYWDMVLLAVLASFLPVILWMTLTLRVFLLLPVPRYICHVFCTVCQQHFVMFTL